MENNEKQEMKPTKTQIETLMSDWLCGTRDQKTFVHKNTDGTIFKKTLSGRALSEYSRGRLDKSDQADVLRQAREIAQGVVDGMTDEPIRVTLGRGSSYTDGQVINVSTDYFDDTTMTLGEKVDVLTGYAIHEACHIRHSDFKQLSKNRDADPAVNRLKRNIDNILEDERIEHLLGESQENGGDGMPGLVDYLGCCKRHSFGKYDAAHACMETTERLPQFLDALLGAIRYPSMLTEEMVARHFKQLDAVRKILRPFPQSPKGVMAATDRIVNVIKDMLDDENDNQKQDDGHGKDSGQPMDNASGKPASQKQDARQELAKALNTDQAKNILSAMEEANAASGGGASNNADCIRNGGRESEYVNGETEKDIGGGAGGTNVVTYIRHANGNRAAYESALRNVKRYVPSMAKALRCRVADHDYVLLGEKTGKLNTNKLVSLKTGNYNIFTKRGEVTSDRVCLCLLIDESGSMSGNGRKEATREAAVLINEAVRHVPNLHLFIYGFTDNDINVYTEGGKEDRWALGTTQSHGGTPTAAAMHVASGRIRRMTNDGCLMLVLTDGEPNDISETIRQDNLLTKKRFVVVGVDIKGGINIGKVFRNSISTTDMQSLAQNIATYVKQKLQKMIGRHDSAA